MDGLPDAPPQPVGWLAAFAVLGATCGLALDALSAVAPDVHHHAGALQAVPHALLLATPLAMLLIVALRLREPALWAAMGVALACAALGALA